MEQNQEPQKISMHKWSLIFDKGSEDTQWGKDGLVDKNGVGKTEYTHAKEWDWTPTLYYTQN